MDPETTMSLQYQDSLAVIDSWRRVAGIQRLTTSTSLTVDTVIMHSASCEVFNKRHLRANSLGRDRGNRGGAHYTVAVHHLRAKYEGGCLFQFTHKTWLEGSLQSGQNLPLRTTKPVAKSALDTAGYPLLVTLPDSHRIHCNHTKSPLLGYLLSNQVQHVIPTHCPDGCSSMTTEHPLLCATVPTKVCMTLVTFHTPQITGSWPTRLVQTNQCEKIESARL